MPCKRYERQIALAISDDLPSRHAHALQQHLDACEACRTHEASLRDALHATRALADINVSEDTLTEIARNVMVEVSALDDRVRAVKAPRWWIVASAIAALVLVCGIMVKRSESQPAIVKHAISIATQEPQNARNAIPSEDESNTVPVQAALVKLYSDNPNVVFYLVSDNNGG